MWVPWPGQTRVYPSQFFDDLRDTLSCLGGGVPRPGDEVCATNPIPWVWAALYFVFNLAFNICLLYLTKV